MSSLAQQSGSLSHDLLQQKSDADGCAPDSPGEDEDASTDAPDSQSCASSGQEAAALTKESVQLLRNVSLQDAKMAGLIRATRDLSLKVFDEDCLLEVTKKSGWKLSLLVSSDLDILCGFTVSKVAKGALSIAKLAVASEFRRAGFGRLIMDEVTKSARKQGDVSEVCLSSLATAVKFYKRLGFKAYKNVKMDNGSDDLVEGQVYMEKKLRQRRK
jgi:ribosomal protein S18 acetylase RimI-like enzyme